MKKRRVVPICLLLLGLTLLGCGQGDGVQPTATDAWHSAEGPGVAQIPATATPQPTVTLPPTDTPTPEPTATPTPEPTATLPPTPTPIPGWEKFEGRGMELWLPESYEGGNLEEDLEVIVSNLRLLGPEFEQMAQIIEQNPSLYAMWAFDSEVGSSGFLVNVNVITERVLSAITVDTYLDAALKQLPPQLRVLERDVLSLGDYPAGRIVVEFDMGAAVAKEVQYAIKDGGTMWIITYAAPEDEFEEYLPVFEQSVLTFRVEP